MAATAIANFMRLDRLVRLIIVNWLFGALVGAAFAGALLAFDLAGVRSLMLRSELYLQAMALLFGGFAVTFGGVVAATSIMLLPSKDDDETSGGGGTPAPALVPVALRRR